VRTDSPSSVASDCVIDSLARAVETDSLRQGPLAIYAVTSSRLVIAMIWRDAVDLDAIERLLQRPAWMADAACRGKVELFYPDGEATDPAVEEARQICAGCPVAGPCAEAGRHEKYGIWAGVTASERNLARRRRRAA
jgi:hypothetical protein